MCLFRDPNCMLIKSCVFLPYSMKIWSCCELSFSRLLKITTFLKIWHKGNVKYSVNLSLLTLLLTGSVKLFVNRLALLRACSYGQKLFRLPRKHFDKFTSEISPCYEIIWKVALRSDGVPRSRLLTGEISVTEIIFIAYMNTTFPLSGKTFCLHFTKSTSQWETLLGKRGKTFLHINRTTLFHLSTCFLGNRDNFCPYEQALTFEIFSCVLVSSS